MSLNSFSFRHGATPAQWRDQAGDSCQVTVPASHWLVVSTPNHALSAVTGGDFAMDYRVKGVTDLLTAQHTAAAQQVVWGSSINRCD